jgi:hypothetical protein
MNFENYHFIYNAAAHFEAQEKYPDGLFKALTAEGAAGFEALCWALEALSTQGELVRRNMGYDQSVPLKAETVRRTLMPYQIAEAKNIVLNATIKGLQPPSEGEEVDEVLQENLKKKESD